MLALLHLWVASYGRAALLLAIGLCIGYPISRTVLRGPATVPMAILIGLAGFGLILCVLAWVRIFTGLTVCAVALIAAAVSLRYAIVDAPRWRARWRSVRRPSAAVIASFGVLTVVLLGFSLLVLYPSTAFDAPSYHLPLARDLVQRHGLVYDPFVRYSFFPQANEMMFAVMMLLTANPAASAALEYSVLAVGVLLLPLWFIGSGRRVGGGFVAALIVLASPVVIYAGTAAFVDTWTLTFVLAGLLLGLDATVPRSRAVATLALAGILFGEAAATKYTGALFGAAALLGVLLASERPRGLWRALPAALGGAGAIAIPWYAWTVHTTVDPLYPFATGIFGNRSGLWIGAELKAQSLVARGFAGPGIGAILRRDLQYLRGAIPYDTGLHRSPLSWLLGVGFLRLLVPSAWRDRTFLGVASAAALCVLLSLWISADPRYLVPAIGPLAVCAGLAADWALSASYRLLSERFRHPSLLPGLCVAAAVLGLWSSTSYALDVHSANGAPPTAASKIYEYLAARIPCYAAVQFLNSRDGTRYRAWGYSCEQARYYAHGRLIGDAFSVGSRIRVFDAGGVVLPSDETLWRRLAPLNVQWIILPVQKVPRPAVLERDRLFRFVATVGPEDIFQVVASDAGHPIQPRPTPLSGRTAPVVQSR